jgi:hypothetical protein
LLQSGLYEPIYFLAGEREHAEELPSHGAIPFQSKVKVFHFGEVYEEFLAQIEGGTAAYFGGGSGPLLSAEFLGEAAAELLSGKGNRALVNNYHSTDWILFRSERYPGGLARRFPADNMLGWVLEHEAGIEVTAAEPSAATRADLDTPVDFMLLYGHPALGDNLRGFLEGASTKHLRQIDRVKEVMKTPASQLAIIGRSSPQILMEISRRCQIWTRVYSEERGMVASGRLEAGEVRSLIMEYIRVNGASAFVETLGAISDAALWDTRVWMAANGAWPSAADRFALDLGRLDEIENPDLLDLGRAIEEAQIPIVHGGHGVVAGGLFAMLETLG